jgi:hypothetical protein
MLFLQCQVRSLSTVCHPKVGNTQASGTQTVARMWGLTNQGETTMSGLKLEWTHPTTPGVAMQYSNA